MADQVEEVKQKTDIVSVISSYVDLKKAGRNYKALCPFHSEKTPSFMVSPELQIYKCFGCGESGDVFSFLQKHDGMDFVEALKFLADRAGVKLKPSTYGDREGKQRLFEINNLAGKFYQYILLKHPAGRGALKYLVKQRGLNAKTIREFNLGFSPDRPNAITKFLVEKKGFKKADLERCGIIYQKGNASLDRFRGRIIFPLYDHRGNAVGFSGRILPGKESGDFAKYINTPETPVYHKANVLYGLNLSRNEIKKDQVAVVVEGELDFLTPWQSGFKNIVAIKGSAFTDEQARLLSRFCKKVTLALDADLAGDSAARRGINIAEAVGLEVKVARLKGYKDPDEMVRKSPKQFSDAIKDAVGVWDFIIDSIFSRFDAETASGKGQISRELIPILASINDEIIKAHYAQVAAQKLDVPARAVVEQIEKQEEKTQVKKEKVEELIKDKNKDRRELLEERFLSLSFAIAPKKLLEKELAVFIATPLSKRIIENFKKYLKKEKDFDLSGFTEFLPKELVEGFAEIVLRGTFDDGSSISSQKKELELIERELRILGVKERLESLAKLIKKHEEEKHKKKLENAEKKFAKLSQELAKLEEKDFGGIIA